MLCSAPLLQVNASALYIGTTSSLESHPAIILRADLRSLLPAGACSGEHHRASLSVPHISACSCSLQVTVHEGFVLRSQGSFAGVCKAFGPEVGKRHVGSSNTLQDIIQIEEGLLVIKLVNVIHCGLSSSFCALSAACTGFLRLTPVCQYIGGNFVAHSFTTCPYTSNEQGDEHACPPFVAYD